MFDHIVEIMNAFRDEGSFDVSLRVWPDLPEDVEIEVDTVVTVLTYTITRWQEDGRTVYWVFMHPVDWVFMDRRDTSRMGPFDTAAEAARQIMRDAEHVIR